MKHNCRPVRGGPDAPRRSVPSARATGAAVAAMVSCLLIACSGDGQKLSPERYGPLAPEWGLIAGEERRVGWLLLEVDGLRPQPETVPTMLVGRVGRIEGSGGINRFLGTVERDREERLFKVRIVDRTRLIADDAPSATRVEERYFAALEQVDSYRLEEKGERLVLLQEDQPLMSFQRFEQPENEGMELSWWQKMGVEHRRRP